MKYVLAIPKRVLLVATILTLALFTSIYPISPWKTVFASPDTQAFYPSDYNLLGSTQRVSGTLSDLQSDDSVYMTFRSYVSSTSTTTKTDAFIGYRSNTGTGLLSSPKNRNWNGNAVAWGGENEMPTAGSPVRFTRVAYCPIENRSFEKIVVTLSDDGYLDAYVWDGTEWNVTNNIGQVWTSAPTTANRPYDIAYESLSGQALLVYGTTVAGGANDLAYRTWTFGTGWNSELYYDDASHGTKVTITFVGLASDLNTDKIGMAYIESTNSDANAVVWDGSSWGNFVEITGTVAITTEECVAIACETVSGAFMAVAGEGQFIKWTRFTTSWSSVGIFDINSGATTAMNWLKLAQSQGNRLMLTSVDGATDLCTAVWDEGLYGNRQWSTASSSIGSMTATTSVTAMRFTAQASKSVTNILVYVQTVLASPAYRFGIETSATTYLPSGTYVGASNYAVYTPTATGWLNLALPSSASLTAGTVYHVTVRYDSGTIGASNYIALRRMGTLENNFRVSENKIDSWLNVIFGTAIQNYEPVFVLQYSDATYESMPYDTATAHTTIYGVNWFSEKWIQNGAQTITGVNIPLLKTGTPADSLYVVLRNETDAQDVATITISQADITTTLQWFEKYFDNPVSLVNGKTYRLILKSPSSISSACFTCRSLSTGQSGSLTYDGTNSVYSASTTSGSSWTDTTTQDLIYIILNSATTLGWVIHIPHDATVDTNAQRCADFAWEYNLAPTFRNQGLLVYGTTTGVITWRRIRAPNYITAVTSPTMAGGLHPWVQLRSNKRTISGDVKILGAVLTDTVFDIGAIRWNGATFTIIGTNTISSDTTVITYECFEIEFMNFGPPTEFTVEVEFTGTSNTESWTSLTWTIDSCFTTDGVTATLQLYNYNVGEYPNSGDGYMTDTIGTSDVTKTQTITTNPTYFRDGSENWKLKVKGVKATSTQFDWRGDLVKIEVAWGVSAYKLNLRVTDWDLTDAIPNAYVTMNNGTDYVQASDSNGWANYSSVSGTVTVKVQYFGFWVNGTFSVTMDSDKTINVQCKLYDATVLVQEGVQNANLASANVTVYNSTSVQGNKITSGVTGNTGQVQLLNLPNNTLTFTQYGGASYSLVIGNITQLVSSENQTITLTADQNSVGSGNSYSIIAFAGVTIPLKGAFTKRRLKKKKRNK